MCIQTKPCEVTVSGRDDNSGFSAAHLDLKHWREGKLVEPCHTLK